MTARVDLTPARSVNERSRFKPFRCKKPQLGLTMVELLVAMALMGVVTVASIAMYNSSAAAYRTVDSSQEMQNKARFIFELVAQGARTVGYAPLHAGDQSVAAANDKGASKAFGYLPESAGVGRYIPPLRGFHNSYIPPASTATVDYDGTHGNMTSVVLPAGMRTSDTLAMRYVGLSKLDNPAAADGSVVDCRGTQFPAPQTTKPNWSDVGLSLFTVGPNAQNEPELYCIGVKDPTAAPSAPARARSPLARGVELFKVLYAIDGWRDEVDYPDRWLTGKEVDTLQLASGGLDPARWARVRWIKVGIVLRGEPGSAQSAQTDPIYVFGKEFTTGKSLTNADAAPWAYVPPDDGRIRKAFTTTIPIRNSLIAPDGFTGYGN
jgi:type IV pilus assembly protein PilW